MRILYDGAIFTLQRAGGINRYFANLIAHLPRTVRPILTATRTADLSYFDNGKVSLHRGRERHWARPFREIGRWQQRREFTQLETGIQADVLHPTYYSLLSAKRLSKQRLPVVLTVYDMIHERFAATLDPRGEVAEVKRQAIRAADAIICISQCTKRDLLEYYGMPEGKISVIYPASGFPSLGMIEATSTADRPYFLFVGGRAHYKNFNGLLQAMKRIIAKRPEVLLVTVGSPFGHREWQSIRRNRLQNHVVNHGHVDDQRLARLYRSSVALVYPSLYEGFGIPPLEAMSCGAAVVCFSTASLPEVVGDAALTVDPNDRDQLADAMLDLLDDPGHRQWLIERGWRRVSKFSWEIAARETADVYRSVSQRGTARRSSAMPLRAAA